MRENSLEITISSAKSEKQGLIDVLKACAYLDNNPLVETSLLVFSHFLEDFFTYLDFVALTEVLLEQHGYEGKYQLATFHPNYCFEGVNVDDVSNYTNRSPYPMLHLLREESLEKAITTYGDTEAIPAQNILLMRRLGLTEINATLESCIVKS